MSKPRIVVAPSFVNDDGENYSIITMHPVGENIQQIVLDKPCVIPVLFLPGIMGTNLRNAKSKKSAWRPPNLDVRGIADGILQLIAYAFTSANARATTLAPDRVEIDPSGPIDGGKSKLPENVLAARGWGALMRSSYHPLMANLQHHLNNLSRYDFERCAIDIKEWAAEAGKDAPTEWGSQTGEALTREEIIHAARYQFDIWAGGYNWLQSNRDSGEQIKTLIEKTILPYYNDGRIVRVTGTPDGKGNEERCMLRPLPDRVVARKVIVVTHSMGGLVSRALTELHGCEKVLGVTHGVQPATGAPAAYKRMRAGFEGAEQVVLGRNAAEVTGISAQSPGSLELLPTADYNGGKPWLFVREVRPNNQGRLHPPILALPQQGDPYKEIYQSSAWYGLVPKRNEGMLTLGTKPAAKSEAPTEKRTDDKSNREEFDERIAAVKEFHEAIQGRYKAPTYVHYGAQGTRDKSRDIGGLLGTGLMASGDRFSWGEVAWEGRCVAGRNPDEMSILLDEGNGELRTTDGVWLNIANPDSPGDGTVPVESGAAPAGKPGVAMSFAHGHDNPGKHNEKFGYDHQGSYNDKRALYATLYAIVKIAQNADWYPYLDQEESA